MSNDTRRKLAALSFSEKIKWLEKLRERSRVLAAGRKRLLERKSNPESTSRG